MRPDHERALTDIEQLLAKLPGSKTGASEAHAAERVAELKVLERVVELLTPHVDELADIIIVGREEITSEAQPSLNQFRRDDHAKKGVLIFESDYEDGTGLPGRLRIWGRYIYLLAGGRLLLVEKEGFRHERKRRGLRTRSRVGGQQRWS
jgi:hypothetical protein